MLLKFCFSLPIYQFLKCHAGAKFLHHAGRELIQEGGYSTRVDQWLSQRLYLEKLLQILKQVHSQVEQSYSGSFHQHRQEHQEVEPTRKQNISHFRFQVSLEITQVFSLVMTKLFRSLNVRLTFWTSEQSWTINMQAWFKKKRMQKCPIYFWN